MEHGHVWNGLRGGEGRLQQGQVLRAHTHTQSCLGGLCSGTGAAGISPSTELFAGFFLWGDRNTLPKVLVPS